MNFRKSAISTLQVLGTILAGYVGGLVCVALKTPIPWMIGPLLMTAGLSIFGVKTLSSDSLRNGGQWVIGSALGLYFTPQVSALVASLWWLVILSIAWALLIGYCYGLWLYWHNESRFPTLDRTTTFFASLVGGAAEMAVLAERENARVDLVASSHTLRVLIVAITIPFALKWLGWQGLDIAPSQNHQFDMTGILTLTLLTGLGALAMQTLGRSNAWFIGPLAVSIALATNQVELSSIPTWLTNAGQIVIGISLGVRFRPEFIHSAPRWLLSVAIGTFGMMGMSALASFGLSKLVSLPTATIILGLAPGGIAEMAITAKGMQLGVAIVTALQACRVIAVLFLAEPLYHRLKHFGLMKARNHPAEGR
jgi:membrane AbrB-like protein